MLLLIVEQQRSNQNLTSQHFVITLIHKFIAGLITF